MGQAKQRGTFEQRKVEGEERKRKEYELRLAIQRRKPSPKHTAFMASMMAIAQSSTIQSSPKVDAQCWIDECAN